MNTLIISPTYNEIKNAPYLIKKIFKVNPDYHLLIVDDNSPDGTARAVKELMKEFPNLFLLNRNEKNGLGKAYINGFNWALEREYQFIIQMDADMSHHPKEIPFMLELAKSNDVIVGSRYINGVSVVNWPIKRLLLSYGANLYSRIITGMKIKDATGGFKLWTRKAISSINFQHVKSSGYSFQIEMNYRAWIKKMKIIEHPIIFIDRTVGFSKMNRSIVFEAVWMVWKLRIWRIFKIIK